MFYSLCIQGIVRHALLRIIGDTRELNTQPTLGARVSLHLGIELFIASSGNHDPLILDYSEGLDLQSEEEAISIRDYEMAQYASYTQQWSSFGITTTKDFLKHLFEFEDIDGP